VKGKVVCGIIQRIITQIWYLPLLHVFYGGEGGGEEARLKYLLPLTPSSMKSMEEGGIFC
jgi:hypothetical protein